MKCIMCGRTRNQVFKVHGQEYTVYIREYKFPHGTIHICESCKEEFSTQLWDFAHPVAWLSGDDLNSPDTGAEHMTEEELEDFSPKELIELAKRTADILWNRNFHDTFHDTLGDTVNEWREKKEKKLVEETPEKELPLLIESLRYESNKKLLEKRLKGEE